MGFAFDSKTFVALLTEIENEDNETKLAETYHTLQKLFDFLQEADYRYSRHVLNNFVELRDIYTKHHAIHSIMNYLVKEVFVTYSSKL